MRDDPEISFNAGSHRFSVRVDRAALGARLQRHLCRPGRGRPTRCRRGRSRDTRHPTEEATTTERRRDRARSCGSTRARRSSSAWSGDGVVLEHASRRCRPHRGSRATSATTQRPSRWRRQPADAGEPRRLEHLSDLSPGSRTVAAGRRPPGPRRRDGPRTAHASTSPSVTAHHRAPRATEEASAPLTDRQLIARLHAFAGVEPRRRTVGVVSMERAAEVSA